jgi:hypothetical protein
MLIADALLQYYRDNGLPSDGGASDPSFVVTMGPLRLRLPNPPARRRAVRMHDINHLLTGYNTVFSEGEMTIAAFEVGAGCGRYLLVWLINLSMFGLGLLVQPRTVYAAFKRGRRSASIYRDPREGSAFDPLTITEARLQLRIDDVSAEQRSHDRLLFLGWAFVAVLLWLTPLLALLVVWWVVR